MAERLDMLLSESSVVLRVTALQVLSGLGDAAMISSLVATVSKCLQDDEQLVREYAWKLLVKHQRQVGARS